MYIVCAILRNAMTCLYGNFTSDFFDIDPPTLQDYFLNNLNKLCPYESRQLIDEEMGNLWTRCNFMYLQPANKQSLTKP